MYTLLTLFFISLASIIIMLGRKVMLVRNGYIVVDENVPHPFIPDIHNVKQATFRGLRRTVNIAILVTLRIYVKLVNLAKGQYNKIRLKVISSISQENPDGNGLLKKEANKFLKVVSEYKHKITRMKRNIHEEEKKL